MLVRSFAPCSLRETGGEQGAQVVVTGVFAPLNVWAEINSRIEGHFMERVAPGAFVRTMAHDRAAMRLLFQHGRDPSIGGKPLGPILTLREMPDGGHFEGELLDAPYALDLLPAIRAGLLGVSMGFDPVQQDIARRPRRSSHNPDGLEERTLRELRIREISLTPTPAYAGTSAGVRCLTDWLAA